MEEDLVKDLVEEEEKAVREMTKEEKVKALQAEIDELNKQIKEEKVLTTAQRKKELAGKVDAAEDACVEAYEELKAVKAEFAEKFKELTKAEADAIVPIEKKIKEAKRAKLEAIAEFNKEFGVPYTKTYTGSEAVKALNKEWSVFDLLDLDIFN